MDQADEQEALHRETRELREELDSLERQTRQARMAVSEPFDPSADPVVRGRRVSPFVVLPAMLVPSVILIAVFFAGGGSSSSETLYGTVRAASGATAVPVGTRCTMFVGSVDDDSKHDAHLTVLCAGHVVYGGPDWGYIDCTRDARLVWQCSDRGYTAESGDPRLELDRRARRVHVDDLAPQWSLDIDLTTPPAGMEVADGRR